jgi:hypothetical protein
MPIPPQLPLFILVSCLTFAPGVAAQDSLAKIERVGTLRDPRLFEASGIAASRAHPGVLWTHNDSGDSATVYAITLAGNLLATYRVPGAIAVDWEDIALGPCPDQAGRCLYIADTGDNGERRRAPTVYVVPEPDPPRRPIRDTLFTGRAHGLRVRYPDGPHDVEAIAVTPQGDAFLISKGRTSPIRVYRIPRLAFAGDSVLASLTDTLPMEPRPTMGRWVTGAAFSPSGKRLVVRTYTELDFFRPDGDGRFSPDGPTCWIGAAEPQGEAVDFLDERTLVLTSESLPNQLAPVLRVSCERRKGT